MKLEGKSKFSPFMSRYDLSISKYVARLAFRVEMII